jgi:hypothetical protein
VAFSSGPAAADLRKEQRDALLPNRIYRNRHGRNGEGDLQIRRPRAYASPCVTTRPVRSVAVCECPDPSATTSCVRSPRRQHDSEITLV